MRPFDAIVLAGGRGTRMGGAEKAELTLGGVRFIDRVLGALQHAEHVVVVGPRRPVAGKVAWTSEEPAGGGPVAAVAAALPSLERDVVVVLAVDLPLIDGEVVGRLVASLDGVDADGVDAVVAVDALGREQYLVAAFERAALVAALAKVHPLGGAPMRALFSHLATLGLRFGRKIVDVDEPGDLQRVLPSRA